MILNTESVNPESNLVVPVPEGSFETGAELDVELRIGRSEDGNLGANDAQHSAGDAGEDVVVQVFDAEIPYQRIYSVGFDLVVSLFARFNLDR